jgi:hypothetical protein
MPDWSADHKISGAAATGLILVADTANGKIYSGGTPKMTHKIKGVKSYDSRGDSTNGGSGAQRQLDEATYVYSENPFVHASTYSLRPGSRTIFASLVRECPARISIGHRSPVPPT